MDKINILLLGSGGRESALAWKMSQSELCGKLYIAPGNGGTSQYGTNVALSPLDFDAVKRFALDNGVNMVVVGNEDPLVAGIYDYFQADEELAKVAVVGPSKAGARLEGSKDFAKGFMERHGIHTAKYLSVTKENIEEGINFLRSLKAPYVLKADGLAAGKGVLILPTLEEAEKELGAMLDGMFGASSATVVIEQFLSGIECSVFVLTDGENYKVLPVAKDYKRIGEGDKGLNTGGMGTVAPNPYYTEEIAKECMEKIFLPTVRAMNAEGRTFKGCLYFGLMLTEDGPKVIEYNCRFGDPETQVVLPLLESDLFTVMQAVTNGTLDKTEVRFKNGCAACVIMASDGYPQKYQSGFELHIDESVKDSVFIAGAKRENGVLKTAGGRVLGVTATADTLKKALDSAYEKVNHVHFENAFWRKDIGAKALCKAEEN